MTIDYWNQKRLSMLSSGKHINTVLQTMRMLHLLSRPEARTISGVNQIPGQPRKQKPDQTLIKGKFLKRQQKELED
jgi:hypothetical protein